MSNSKVKLGSLVAVTCNEVPPRTYCTWCNEKVDKQVTLYRIENEKKEVKGHICGRCSNTPEWALVLFGEDGSLF